MNSVNLISTDDLLDELISRFDHIAFIGVKELQIRKDKEEKRVTLEFTRRWSGNSLTVMGLCQDLSNGVWEDFKERETLEENK